MERLNRAPTSELIELEMLEDRIDDEYREELEARKWWQAMIEVFTPLWLVQIKTMVGEGRLPQDKPISGTEDL